MIIVIGHLEKLDICYLSHFNDTQTEMENLLWTLTGKCGRWEGSTVFWFQIDSFEILAEHSICQNGQFNPLSEFSSVNVGKLAFFVIYLL